MTGDSVRVTVFVGVSPHDAFEVFTQDVNLWWREGARYRSYPHDSSMAFEESKRFVEIRSDGTTREIGRVLVWEPAARLVFEWKGANFEAGEVTVVEVDFTAKRDGTEVVLVHRGWAGLRPDHPVRHGQAVAPFLGTMGRWWADLLTACRMHVTR